MLPCQRRLVQEVHLPPCLKVWLGYRHCMYWISEQSAAGCFAEMLVAVLPMPWYILFLVITTQLFVCVMLSLGCCLLFVVELSFSHVLATEGRKAKRSQSCLWLVCPPYRMHFLTEAKDPNEVADGSYRTDRIFLDPRHSTRQSQSAPRDTSPALRLIGDFTVLRS